MPGGQPAATVGSLTAHGGVVTQGAPTVFINGQPAARQGDLHVCPLCSPTPHVGGPILNGAPNVLIAGQPIATVNSLATCASPAPDMIVQGAPNVLISQGGQVTELGMGGQMTQLGLGGQMTELGGAGGASGGGGAVAAGAQASTHAAQQGTIEATEEAEPAARVRYVDKGGEPINGPRYKHTGGGEETESALRVHGEVRRAGTAGEGQQETAPYGVAGAQWSKSEARVGEEVGIEAKAFGFEEGTAAKVLIYRREEGSDVLVAALDAEVSGGKVEANWAYTYDEDAYAERQAADPAARPQLHMPVYVAKVHVHPETAETGALSFQDWIELEVADADDAVVPRAAYRLVLGDGQVRTGQADARGIVREDDMPPGEHDLTHARRPRQR